MAINVKKEKNLWNLCALIRTSIRVIRAECGEETHSASPSTHKSPLNPCYPWSANPFFVISEKDFILVKMASSLASIAETWPENVLPSIVSRKSHCVRKIMLVPHFSSFSSFFSWIFGIISGPGWIFRTKCDFLQVLNLHIFRQKQPGHWGRGCLPFSPK